MHGVEIAQSHYLNEVEMSPFFDIFTCAFYLSDIHIRHIATQVTSYFLVWGSHYICSLGLCACSLSFAFIRGIRTITPYAFARGKESLSLYIEDADCLSCNNNSFMFDD